MRFRHREGTKLWHLPQVTGSGVALIDFDGDGQLDAFFVQGSGAADAPPRSGASSPPCELYRNRTGRFEECAAAARADVRSCGMGVASFDYDADGYADLAVTRFQRPVLLLRNNGDGTFADASRRSGVARVPMEWGSSLTPLDYDRDGLLDLYVGQYLQFDDDEWTDQPQIEDLGQGPSPDTLLPGGYPALPNVLFHNDGNGAFSDRTARAGVADGNGQTLGAIALDFDGDGWPDLMTANDGLTRNSVFRNAGGGRFHDVSRGTWADEARGSMGFAVADLARDGTPFLFVSHWMNQPSLYRVAPPSQAGKRPRFADEAGRRGLTREAALSGWAVAFLDVDNDSHEDLLQIAGFTGPHPGRPRSGTLEPQAAYLFRNRGDGVFARERGTAAGDPVDRTRVGRGAAVGALDRDGSVDVVLNDNNQPAEVWRGTPTGNSWIGLWPVGTRSNRDAIGTSLLVRAGTVQRRKWVCPGESYFSANARHVLCGLGPFTAPVSVRVRWPTGVDEEFAGLATRRYHRLVEGSGRRVAR